MMRPASTGPIILAPLNAAEFSATAFSRRSRSTIWMRKDCLVGMSKALMLPSVKARARMYHTVTVPVSVRMPMRRAGSTESPWVRRRMFRFRKRSAAAPPRRLKRRMGSDEAVDTRPR
jgi:hypothetical protein